MLGQRGRTGERTDAEEDTICRQGGKAVGS